MRWKNLLMLGLFSVSHLSFLGGAHAEPLGNIFGMAKEFGMSISEMKQVLEDPKVRDEVLAELLSLNVQETSESVRKTKQAFLDSFITIAFAPLDSEKKTEIYQKAMQYAVLAGDSEKASQLLAKGARGNQELNRQFVCSAMVSLLTKNARLTPNQIGQAARSGEMDPANFRQVSRYVRALEPLIARNPSLEKERCSLGAGDTEDLQIRDLMKVSKAMEAAKSKVAGKKSQTETKANLEPEVTANESISGCSKEALRFLTQKSLENIKSTKVGTWAQFDESYEQCHVKGTLQKVSADTFIFIAGHDLKNSPRTLYFRDANEAVRLMLPFQKSANRPKAVADNPSSGVSGTNNARVSIASPFGSAR